MTRFLASYFAASILVAASLPAYAQTIKFGTLAPEGWPWHQIIRDIAESWKEISAGTVEVRIYAGGVAGNESEMVRKMRVGQLHAAALSGTGLARIAQEVQALQMPMMFRSDAELDHVRNRLNPRLEAILEERGFVLLAWGNAGWAHFFAQEPVVHPDDLKPLKLSFPPVGYCSLEGPNDCEIFLDPRPGFCHANPWVPTSAFATTPVAALSCQWFGLAPHMTDLKWAPLVSAVIISKRAWVRIAEDLRPKFREAAQLAGQRLQAQVRTLERDAVEFMQKHSLTVHPVPQAVVDEWEREARKGYRRIVGAVVPPGIVAEVERFLKEYRARAQD